MISVIMCVYKEKKEYLKKSVESILNQTLKEFEYIIIIDNPDNLDAIEIINEYAEKDSRIKMFINSENIGLTASLNRALSLISGEYVARMDADDIAELNRLELQFAYLNENKLDIVGSSLRRISESGEIVNEYTNKSYRPETISRLLKYDDPVAHPSWFLRRSVYEDLNGYREIKACEDYDFLLRALHKKAKIGICNSITMNYRINTSGISRTNSLRQMLSSDYLQKNLDRIESVTQEEIDVYLKRYITPEKNFAYENALNKMNEIFENVKKKKYLQILKIPFLCFKSKYILINIKKIVCMKYIKMRYR